MDVCEGRSIAALFLVREWLSKPGNQVLQDLALNIFNGQ